MQVQSEAIAEIAYDPAKTRQRLDEARDRLKEMEKKIREEKQAIMPGSL